MGWKFLKQRKINLGIKIRKTHNEKYIAWRKIKVIQAQNNVKRGIVSLVYCIKISCKRIRS